jgi:hypothetical protein
MELIKTVALGAALSYIAVSAYNQPVHKLAAAIASPVDARSGAPAGMADSLLAQSAGLKAVYR